MNLDELTIGQGRELARMFGAASVPAFQSNGHPYRGRYVLARTYSAGVHLGTLVRCEGTEVVLKDARRLWSWAGAFTLSEISQKGCDMAKSRLSAAVPEIYLSQAVEIIPCSAEVADVMAKAKEYRP